MVISNDEPDIAVGGVYDAPIATAVPASAAAFNDPNKNIERTTNADGSLAVKVTTTSRQSNGYREVTIEYFYVPASMAGTVIMSMDATGEPPSSLYMTEMEQQVLPPGTGAVMSHAPSAPQTVGATAAGGGGYPAPQPYVHNNTAIVGGSNYGGSKGIACIAVTVIAIVAVAIVAGVISKQHTDYNWPTPAPWNSPPSPWNPTPWNFPTPRPTRTGCTDTPDWVDIDGFGCDFYENSWMCYGSSSYQGSMGPATKHCCFCGGGSTYVPPTPMPSGSPTISRAPTTPWPTRAPTTPRPTQPSACIDTPGFVDSSGWGCNRYQSMSFFCEDADVFKGDMGSATEHCCVCGGGNVPSKPSKAPAIFNTPSVAPTPPTPAVAVPTLASKDKMDSNLSDTNPFRSPSAVKEE